MANNNKADLFISLHANASVRGSAAGAEVFYLSLGDYGAQAQRVAQGESEAMPVFGGGTRDIDVILGNGAGAAHRAVRGARHGRRGVAAPARADEPAGRPAGAVPVLVGANMPAVLVEMGFITNPEQERQLASEAFQSSIVQALVDSLAQFRDSRTTQRSVPPVTGARD